MKWKKLTCAFMAAIVAVSMLPAAAVSAEEQPEAQAVSRLIVREDGRLITNAFNSLEGQVRSEDSYLYTSSEYPSAFSLRNAGGNAEYNTEKGRTEFSGGNNYVTSVKSQAAWGTCWAFGHIAAAESSILSESGQDAEGSGLDLSEHHTSWFAKNHIAAEGEDGYDPAASNNQSGEGIWYFSGERESSNMHEGYAFYGTQMFSHGQGAVSEDENEALQYKGVEGHVVLRDICKNYYQFDSYEDVPEELKAIELTSYYSTEDDWTLDESMRFMYSYVLEDGAILPDSNLREDDGTWAGYNGDIAAGENEGVRAVKEQLLAGRGVTVGFCAENTAPNQPDGSSDESIFLNTKNWAHYTWDENSYANHEVVIVGYDDNFAASNFTNDRIALLDENGYCVYKLLETELPNTEFGEPYYIDPAGEQVVLSTDSSLLVDTGKTDEGEHVIYRLSGEQLVNNAQGAPLIPGSETETLKYKDRKVLCEAVTEPGGYTPEGDGAWIVKNSWGAASEEFPNMFDWGEEGYFYLSYYDKSICCCEALDFSLGDDAYTYDFQDAYDYVVSDGVTDFISPDSAGVANVFTAEVPDESYKAVEITAVSCLTATPGTVVDYELYVLNDDAESPLDGRLAATVSDVEYNYGGYHLEKLDTPVYVKAGQKYSVVVKGRVQMDTGLLYIIPMTMDLSETGAIAEDQWYYTKAVVNEGESYYVATTESGETTCKTWEEYISLAVTEENMGMPGEYFAVDNPGVTAFGDYLTAELGVSSENNEFMEGAAAADAVFTFGEGLEGFGLDNFDADKGVTVDDTVLDSANYTVENGSLKLTLLSSYLNTMTEGTHVLKIALKDSASLAGMPEYLEAEITVLYNPAGEKYRIEIEGGTADPEEAEAGTTVTVTANAPKTGISFANWEVLSGAAVLADEESTVTTFTMPAEDVRIKAVYKNEDPAPVTPTVTPTVKPTATPGSGGNGKNISPVNTGDDFSAFLWILLAAAAAGGVFAAVTVNRQRKGSGRSKR